MLHQYLATVYRFSYHMKNGDDRSPYQYVGPTPTSHTRPSGSREPQPLRPSPCQVD